MLKNAGRLALIALSISSIASCGARKAPEGEVEWVRIAGGEFLMGLEKSQLAEPVHRVTVPTFEISKTLVTNKQYDDCVAAGACTPTSACESKFNLGGRSKGNDQPVICVDWKQAKAFAQWVGGRLPSEAEWEYAASSGGKPDLACVDDPSNCERKFKGSCAGDTTCPVCSKPIGNTEQGLCDMGGDAVEWTEDWYHNSYDGAPRDGSAWVSPAGSERVTRGWGFGAQPYFLAYRTKLDPAYGSFRISFRVAR